MVSVRAALISGALMTAVLAMVTPRAATIPLPPIDRKVEQAWLAYLGAAEQRIRTEVTSGRAFLGLDLGPSRAADRHDVLQGAIVVREVPPATLNGRALEVPDALVHHWRGAILLPGAKLDDLIKRLKMEAPRPDNQDVLASSILEQRGDTVRVAIKVQRIRFVRVVYNTEHTVAFERHNAARASTRIAATKIAEVADPGTPSEREVGAGHDRGFLWRWHSYWRYEQTPEGVIAECESISLSRPVPWGLGFMVGRLIDSTARQSMERALVGVKGQFAAER